jgi:beta-glucanase (GH16 family)
MRTTRQIGPIWLLALSLIGLSFSGWGLAWGQGESLDRSGFVKTFDDEFDRPLDKAVWTPKGLSNVTVEKRTLPSNGELELYVDPQFQGRAPKPLGLETVRTRNGKLEITAVPTPPALKEAVWGYPYLSGEITTQSSFSQTYGYYEIRAKIPKGKGYWPGFWMLLEQGGWPPEIDILEALGREPNVLYTSVHSPDPKGQKINIKRNITADLSAAYHIYGMRWDAKLIRFYLDNREIYWAPTPKELHQPCFLLLNLAVGGGWAQTPDNTTKFPGTYFVDWVRVYQIAKID